MGAPDEQYLFPCNGNRQFRGDLYMKVHYYACLTDDEYALTVKCLLNLKNALLSEGRYTDAVDDILLKFAKLKKKKAEVRYIKA